MSNEVLVEHVDGRMELLHWADEIAARDTPSGSNVRADTVTRAA